MTKTKKSAKRPKGRGQSGDGNSPFRVPKNGKGYGKDNVQWYL